MEKIKRNKFTVSVVLLVIVALLATVLFTVLGNDDVLKTEAATISVEEVENATIGDHGVGEIGHLAQSGGDNAVLERWGLLGNTNYRVVWVSSSDELKRELGTATAAGTAGTNTIIVFTKNIDWNQSSIADDVGTQKFVGILDGNGYQLNINLTASTGGGNGKKQDNNNAYYKVTQNDLGDSAANFSGTDGNGMRGMGLVVGVNAGTIANMTINYSASGSAMTNVTQSGGEPVDGASLDSASNPDVPYGFGIVTGINIGTIDNVYVNQQSIFTGNAKSHAGTANYDYPANAFENCASVGGIAGANMGYGKINNCYMYIGNTIWAQADGAWNAGLSAAYSAAFAGGITGWIRGNNSQITYCYIDGNGEVNSWAMRGADYPGVSTNYCISFSGGVTTGKFQLYIQSQALYRYSYVTPQDMGANQVKGIISNWKGIRRDSYASGTYMSHTSDYMTSARKATGMPFDFLKSADQGSDKQDMIVFTYNYKYETGNTALDMPHSNYNGSTNGSAVLTSNWSEVYSWTHSLSRGESSVSVTFEDGYLRIQANADQYVNSTGVDLDSVTRSSHPSGYMPTYNDSYVGNMIWGTDIYTIGPDIAPESKDNIASVVIRPTSKVGSFVRYFNPNMTKGSYVIKFGSTYSYTVTDNKNATTRQYNGDDVSDMLPSLSLKNSNGDSINNPNTAYYQWSYSVGGSQVELEDTIYPATYTIQPMAVIDDAVNSEYVYYDAAQRTLALNKGYVSTVIVSKATLSLDYTETEWVNSASIGVEFTTNGSASYTTIIDAYQYQGGTNNSIIDLNLSGTNNFTIVENTTTPKNGRQIFNVVAFVKKADGTYVQVADTTKAAVDKKSVTIKVDNAVPVLTNETYYLANQFGEATIDEIGGMIAADPSKYVAVSSDDVRNGKWFGEQIIAVANVGDESRSGVNERSVGVQEAAPNGTFGNVPEENYYSTVGSDGNAVIVVRVTGQVRLQIAVSDVKGNSSNIILNGGESVNIDNVELAFNSVGFGNKTLETTYNIVPAAGKAFSRIRVKFNATFGGSGLNVWYYIDNDTQLTADSTDVPEGAEWKQYTFTTSVVSGNEASIIIPEGMENAALFLMFKNGVEESEAVVMRVTTNTYSTFTVDLNGANIQFNAKYVTVTKTTTNEAGEQVETTYNLDQLVNGQYEGVNLVDFFSKTYDGTDVLNKNVKFGFTIDESVALISGTHYTGDFLAVSEQGNFRTSWLQVVAEYDEVNSGSCALRIYMTTTSESPIDMNIAINYGGDTGVQQTLSVPTRIDRINMAFDIDQIFSEGADITMSKGSYTIDGTDVTFNWVYGDVFDGLVVTINNDEAGGTMSFRFNCNGKNDEKYMNVGGSYSAYVDAIKIDSPVYQMDDFAQLVNNGGSYTGDAGLNYTVSISREIPIKVAAKEVRLTFALDGSTKYSFSIPYDTEEHVMTAQYTDVDGNVQNATVTWRNSSGAVTTLNSIKEIGVYTAEASIQDGNYVIKGQYKQTITIQATYLDIFVPDKTVQYNDGSAVTYIPDLPENSPIAGKTVVYTITYYKKLADSIQLLGTNVEITEVGEYYVSVTFDPKQQTDPDLQKFARKEYTKEGGTGLDSYIAFNVVKADTAISGVESQISTYNASAQMIKYSDAVVKSLASKKDVSGANIVLQYWDDAQQSYVNFDASSNNGKYENVGTYKYRLVYEGNENYNESSVELTLQIDPATITGVIFGSAIEGDTVTGISQQYNGKEISLAADISGSNVKNNPDVKVEYRKIAIGVYTEDVPTYISVGRNQVWLRVSCGDNYQPYETTAYVIITAAPAPDDIVAFDSSNPGGIMLDEIEYDGKEHSIKYTLNTGKYGEDEILSVSANATSATDVGEYNGSIEILLRNYEAYYHDTSFTIVPKKITEADKSIYDEIQAEEGLTSDTNLYRLVVTFTGVDGETVEAQPTFWQDNKIVFPDALGRLPAGTYKVTYDAGDNYDLSAVTVGELTLAQGTGEIVCDHADENGDGICDKCGTQLSNVDENCDHVDSDGDGKCDKCGASMGNVTPPKDNNAAMYVVVAICCVLIVASIAGVIVAAVMKSRKKNKNRYNII